MSLAEFNALNPTFSTSKLATVFNTIEMCLRRGGNNTIKYPTTQSIYSIATSYATSYTILSELNPSLTNNNIPPQFPLCVPQKPLNVEFMLCSKRGGGYKPYNSNTDGSIYAIANHYGCSIATIKALNPEILDFDAIPLNQLVPMCVPKIIRMIQKVNGIEEYIVQTDEDKYTIFSKFGMFEKQLEALNPTIDYWQNIEPGMKLAIQQDHKRECIARRGTIYTYNAALNGSVYMIANQRGITLENIKEMNLKTSVLENAVPDSWPLCLPNGSGTPSDGNSDTTSGRLYTVTDGDDIYTITQKNNISIQDIKQKNPSIDYWEKMESGMVVVV
jgi:hypothetical protein